MGRPKGKKDSKPRAKKGVKLHTPKATKITKPAPLPIDETDSDEFVADAPEEVQAPEIDLTAEVELLLKGIFEALALIFGDNRIGLDNDEVKGSAPSCVAFYKRVIKPKIENTDTLAAAVVIGALLMSRAPYIKEAIQRWRKPKLVTPTYSEPSTEAKAA